MTKAYGSVVALSDFSHSFAPGGVHALMGKNGSGKSTLVKLLAGAIAPTRGEIRVDGAPMAFRGPQDSLAGGIATVHQELSLAPSLSIGENIFLGRLPLRRRFGVNRVDWRSLHRRASQLLEDIGLETDSRKPASSLSLGQQQIVEIARAVSFDPSVLLLDEPTSALATREVNQLFAIVRRLRARGVTILYITHRMSELFEIADTCTVLRDGRRAGALDMNGAAPEDIVDMMFGEAAKSSRPPRRPIDRTARPLLEVENLGRGDAFSGVSFSVHRGEIVGLAGLLGSGRTEVLRAVFGADRVDEGRILIEGRECAAPDPRSMKRAGLGYTPENRKEVGLVQALSTHENLCLASLSTIAPFGFVTRAREKPFVQRQIDALAIKVGDAMNPVSSLSGGNQQKVVIGNWFNTQPKVMLFDEPSRGVDIQAKRQIFEILWREAERGLGAVFVSTELEEVLEVSDRILVMREGKIVAELAPEAVNLTELYRLCMEGPTP